ncbi:MAG: DUF6273 domain-containing protein [Dysgonamonadaceae bacterium]|jgi:hypothetical protein|nr:DUF6273 domain-containing protein [Dysgonamonadaceae bacterium]
MEKDDFIKFGNYDWQVLDVEDNKALLLCEEIIENRKYDDENVDTTWETCTLRKYLNNEFFDNFPESDKSRIVEKWIDNDYKEHYYYCAELCYGQCSNLHPNDRKVKVGNKTNDRIFLLSIEEVEKYLVCDKEIENSYLRNRLTARIREAQYEYRGSLWWLRSPGWRNRDVTLVRLGGKLCKQGVPAHNIWGVRPALWVEVE